MGSDARHSDAIPFEVFAGFEWIEMGNPILACRPPEWAAATHAIVVGDTLHYYWAKRPPDRRWLLMHATAPAVDPADGKYYMYYRGKGEGVPEQTGLAEARKR
jgi:hypothetical protein